MTSYQIRLNAFKSMLLISMLLFFYPDSSFSQHVTPVRSHAINDLSKFSQPNVPDTVTIVAVRVEFQTDNNRFTTGNGTFDEENLSFLNNPEITIDPLPHNRQYFDSHLQFVQNYFRKVSGNQLEIQSRILPDIYQLPQKMEDYSPTGQSFTNEKLANLTRDTWNVVEQQGGFSTNDLDPEKTAFIIFHAGVGRDIELVGTSLDKTPQDIPSVYLDQNTLSESFKDPDFDGFNINNGDFKITNSAIVPRTLSRPGEDVAGDPFVLQLSINGLLCASIGSFLGLPDLFDTETGNSGIGRFGLMDGESFFSYRGLFPPEPSAWEKSYLGWETPFPITVNTSNSISLPAASINQQNSIAKFELSKSEYFLIENRHRDPNNDGITVTFQQSGGTSREKHFNNYNEAFVDQTENFEETLIRGVVTDVSNFDWSLPGGLDPGLDESVGTSDDRLLNGGILIWHIDESVISSELATNTINSDTKRRGIDLEEADGAQDIGRAASDDFGNQARGTAFDFWWSGNDASVIRLEGDTLQFYENRFGPDTNPSNESNSGAASFFELYDFSDNLPTASFRIRSRTNEDIQPIMLPADSLPEQTAFTYSEDDYFESYPLALSFFKSSLDSFLVIPTRQSTYALKLEDNEQKPLFNFQSGQPQQPYIGNSIILGGAPTDPQISITSWKWNGTDWNAVWDQQANANNAFLSSQDDQILWPDFTDQQINISDGTFSEPLDTPQQRSVTQVGKFTTLTDQNLILHPDQQSASISAGKRQYTGTVRVTKDQTAFFYLTDDELMVFDPQNFSDPQTILQNTPLGWPAMVDINDDGRIDFIYVNKKTNALEARNRNGAMLAHFPIQPPDGVDFVGTPLIATSEQSDKPTLFITAQDSLSMNIHAYASNGKSMEGFPLYVGSVTARDNDPIHPLLRGTTLWAVSHLGELKGWEISSIENVLWKSQYGNTPYNKVSGQMDIENESPSEFQNILVEEETYNWPNPAEEATNLRFQTSSPGFVYVKIINAGGSVIFEERYESNGTGPEERRISTQNWSSGVYFAMVTATVNGEKARKMLKIAVIQ